MVDGNLRNEASQIGSVSHGYWKEPVIDVLGNIIGGTFVSHEQEALDTISDRLARIEEKLDRLLAAKE